MEESGLAGVCVHESIGTWDRVSRSGPSEPGPEERHRWHLYTLIAPDAVADAWQHVAEGSPEESGLTFSFRWVPIDESLAAALHPLFGPVAHMIVDHFRAG